MRGARLDAERRFDHFVTYDRDLMIKAAQPLPHRLVPSESP